MMGCDCEDSIEHYATCKQIILFGSSNLWLPPLPPHDRLAGFLGLLYTGYKEHAREISRRALLTTAVYKLHCWWRHKREGHLSPAGMLQALRVQLREVLAANWEDSLATTALQKEEEDTSRSEETGRS